MTTSVGPTFRSTTLQPPSAVPLRVLLISHTCQSKTEGQPKAELLAARHDVRLKVLVPDRWTHYGRARTADVPTDSGLYEVGRVRLPWVGPAQYYLHHYPHLGRVLREFRPDVIDVWEEPWGMISAQVCRLRNRLLPGTPVISETEQNLNRRLPPPFEWFRSYTFRHCDFLVGRSTEAVEVARVKGYRGPAAVVPNAVDTKLFLPMDRVACRRKLRWPDEAFVAGYVGRLVERKGITDFLDALEQCDPRVTAVFVGDGPMAADIGRRATTPRLAGRVKLLAALPLLELPELMNAFDVLVLPSRTVPTWKEQFGRVIIEAQACGVPVIGSDSGAIGEIVADGGLVFPERDVATLASQLSALAADPTRTRALGAAGYRQIGAKYTWERVAAQMAGIFHSCRRRGIADPVP